MTKQNLDSINKMDDEEYIEYLKSQSGYCNCPDLSELKINEERAQSLETLCFDWKRKIDFEDISKENINNLLDYRNALEKFEESKKTYYSKLNELVEDSKLRLISHNQEDSIMTIHCSNCDKQIDLVNDN